MRNVATIATLAVIAATAVSGCSSGRDYYSRDPYKDDRTINAGLLRSENKFVDALSHGDMTAISKRYTAPPKAFAKSMARFVDGYARHPSATTARQPGDDATADQTLTITCSVGQNQTVDIAWAWFNGAWRAWPADQDNPYPGC